MDQKHIGMCTLVVSQIWWTYEVEDAFRQVRSGNKLGMKQIRQKLVSQIVDIVGLIREKPQRLERKKINTLIINNVHARDLEDSFIGESVLNVRKFQWESQLQHYPDKTTEDISIKQCAG